jgi:hypothetical protein
VDTGARGPRGAREKEIALKVALALARELEEATPTSRSASRAIRTAWYRSGERGEWCHRRERRAAGSVHLAPRQLGARVLRARLRTYFLSRRAPSTSGASRRSRTRPPRRPQGPVSGDPELEGIVKELQIFDHQHWSALLAEMVQEEMARVHPGPNRA